MGTGGGFPLPAGQEVSPGGLQRGPERRAGRWTVGVPRPRHPQVRWRLDRSQGRRALDLHEPLWQCVKVGLPHLRQMASRLSMTYGSPSSRGEGGQSHGGVPTSTYDADQHGAGNCLRNTESEAMADEAGSRKNVYTIIVYNQTGRWPLSSASVPCRDPA